MLQTRSGKRTSKSAVKIAVDMVKEKLISKKEAILKIDPNSLDTLLHPTLDEKSNIKVIGKGLPAFITSHESSVAHLGPIFGNLGTLDATPGGGMQAKLDKGGPIALSPGDFTLLFSSKIIENLRKTTLQHGSMASTWSLSKTLKTLGKSTFRRTEHTVLGPFLTMILQKTL